MRKEATAYHEAGHVGAQLYFEHTFDHVSIKADGVSSGRVAGILTERMREIIIEDTRLPTAEDERYFKHEMITLMAGGVAQMEYSGSKRFSKSCQYDFSNLVLSCGKFSINGKALYYYSRYIIEEANRLMHLVGMWDFVERLAGQLLIRKELTYFECASLYKVMGGLYFNVGSEEVDVNEINERPAYWRIKS